jgi:hypothetical protein
MKTNRDREVKRVPLLRWFLYRIGSHRWIERRVMTFVGPDLVEYVCYWCGKRVLDAEEV